MKKFQDSDVLFYEKQVFDQFFLRLTIVVAGLFPFVFFSYGYYYQVLMNQTFGTNPSSDEAIIIALIVSALFGFGIIYLFFSSKLETYVTSEGLHVRLYPFMKYKTYKFEEIKSCTIREYKPLLEYGGWGIRHGFAGLAFNVSGNIGLQLVMLNKKKVLIGTKKANEFCTCLSKMIENNKLEGNI